MLVPLSSSPLRRALLLLLLVCLFAACGEDEPAAPSDLEVLRWEPIEGAERYRVRLWSGYRLLFEAQTRDTLLVLDANLRRTSAAFDTLSLELLGYESWEDDAVEMGRSRRRLRP